jgi:hypothetical protein
MMPASVIRAMLMVAAASAGYGAAPAQAQLPGNEVAYVEAVSGRVVAGVRGTPVLVAALDIIGDRTRFDLLPNSELRLCHYQTARFMTVRGPARVTVTAAGITVEAGKAAEISQDVCAFALASEFQGGILARGVRKPK